MTDLDIRNIVLCITMEDVVRAARDNDDNNELPAEVEDLLRDSQRSFEKALAWSVMEHIWSVIHDVTDDILRANGLTRPEFD